MKKTCLLLALFLLLLEVVSAQTSNEKIVFPTPADMLDSKGQFLIQTADGGYLLSGSTSNSNAGSYAVPRLIKLNADLQVEWDKKYLEQSSPEGLTATIYSPAQQTADGGYAFGVRNDSSATDFLRLDANGNVLWEKDLVAYAGYLQLLGILSDGSYALTTKQVPYILFRLDAAGNTITQTTLVSNASNGHITSVLLSNGDVLTMYRAANLKTVFLRTTIDGTVIWQVGPLSILSWFDNLGGPKLAATNDGGFVVLDYNSTQGNNRLLRFDALGNQIWQSADDAIPSTLVPTEIAVAPNGRFILSGRTSAYRGFIAQMNAAADGIEWSADSPEDGQEHLQALNAIPTADGWAAGVGLTTGDKFGFLKVSASSAIFINTLSGRVAKDDDDDCVVESSETGLSHAHVTASNGLETFITFTDFDGYYTLALPTGDFTVTVQANEPFFSLCPAAVTDVYFAPGASGTAFLDLPMQSPELIHELTGTVRLDQNNNCVADAGEPVMANWHVNIITPSGNLHLTTNADGLYRAFVPDGSYQVWLSPFNNHFSVCAPSVQSVSLAGPSPQTATLDFVAEPEFLCARMRAELGANNIRPCTTSTLYAYYRNDGTSVANDASMIVTLDPLLGYLGASPTPDLVDGQTLTFNLGDLPAAPAGTWTEISIQVMTDCSLSIGDQVCVSTQVYPDEDCTESPNWSGAIVAVEGVCENNEQAVFTIRNVGNAPNAGLLHYIITEDLIVLREGYFQLDPNDFKNDTVPASGLPLTLLAQQEPGYPGDTSVVWNIVNCGGTGSGISSGFGGPAGPFTHQECFQISSSFDPNDKTAIPAGNGPAHLVHPGTPLEYHIRFQNTGNDTAFLVVIRDTLSQHFNFGKIEPRGSSHNYAFAQINDSILQFTFKNILLPDSTTNREGSQGFVEFNVYPKDNLPDGTEVRNSAAIYFDFNAPVITNTVQRVYGKYYIVKTREIPGQALVPVKVYPNPLVTETTFEIPEDAAPGPYQLLLLDETGRALRTLHFEGHTCKLRREDLPMGVLAWSISTAGKTIAGGTIVAQ